MQKDLAVEMKNFQEKQKASFENFVSKKNNLQKTSGGVYVDVKNPGNGPAVDTGKVLSVKYTGKLMPSEKVFETNMDDPNKQPIEFQIGTGSIIRGWEEGLRLFHAGGKGTLYVPYQLAYNDQPGPGGIPFQNLIFDVEIVGVNDAPPQPKQMPLPEMDTTRPAKRK
jgi:FKBP-type peptidyl-prolyl cis-trans isomerase